MHVHVCSFVLLCFSSLTDRMSERQVSLYKYPEIESRLSNLSFSVTPSTMKAHYDPDIRLLYLTGKVKGYTCNCKHSLCAGKNYATLVDINYGFQHTHSTIFKQLAMVHSCFFHSFNRS